MKLLTDQQQELYENAKICYICKEKFEDIYIKDKKCCKIRDHCHYKGEYRGAGHSIRNRKHSVPKKISIVFYIGVNYDCHFIIKELGKEIEEKSSCLGKNIEKCIAFSVPIEIEVTTTYKLEEISKTITYRLQFIDSEKFMGSSSPNLVDYCSEGTHKIMCRNCE